MLILRFLDDQLWETSFKSQLFSTVQISVRGKTSGACFCTGTFQWTSAVQGLSYLILKTLIHTQSNSNQSIPSISGGQGSLASSLDHAISKQTIWLQDMFGVDYSGTIHAKRLLLRTNSNRKRPGPVIIAINKNYLPYTKIKVQIDSDINPGIDKLSNLAKAILTNAESRNSTSCNQ